MIRLGNKYSSFRYTGKTHSAAAIASMVFSVILLLLYTVIVLLASYNGGTMSVYYGSLGLLALFLSIGNLILSLESLRGENALGILPRVAFICSALSTILWVGTYIIGIFA